MRGARERFEPLMLDHVGYDFNIINEVCVKVRGIFNPEASRGAGVQTCSQYELSVMPNLSITNQRWRRERDLNSRVTGTVDFESTAIPGYAISAADVRFSATVISMMLPRSSMEIHLKGRDHDVRVEVDGERTVRQALVEAGILPSTVIVSYDGTILPHATVLSQSVKLLVTTVSSGG